MYIFICMYMHICIYTYIHMHIYKSRTAQGSRGPNQRDQSDNYKSIDDGQR